MARRPWMSARRSVAGPSWPLLDAGGSAAAMDGVPIKRSDHTPDGELSPTHRVQGSAHIVTPACTWSARGVTKPVPLNVDGKLSSASVTSRRFGRIVLQLADLTFAAIYNQYVQDVYRFALYLSGNRETAEDLAAETFAKAWSARDRVRVGTVKAYLLMITRNLYRDSMRRRPEQPLQHEWLIADDAANPEAIAAARGELRVVLDALHALPEIDRSILLMATVGDVPYEAIGVAFDMSVSAVKVRVHRARVKLNAARFAKERP
jgi:RNA polymerase sigma factor (sigma-70 family)